MTEYAGGRQLLEIANAVAEEKFIDRDKVLDALAEAVQRAARTRYGAEMNIHADIDPENGDIKLFRLSLVVEEVEDENTQISLADALARNPAAQIGDSIAEDLPPIEFDRFGRIAAQMAKPIINQKVREAEREREFEEFRDRIGDVVNGSVLRVEYGDVVVDLDRGEGVLQRGEYLPSENLHIGDRVRALIYDVRREQRGRQIFLTRTRSQFMEYLFSQEVPEIHDGTVELKAVARDPGSRAKIAVISNDSSIDPVGACVGMRGNRVQAVVNELQGEKVDIVPWSPDPATFIVNALVPAEVSKVVLDEDHHKIEVVVPEEQLSLAIGRRGQNVRLASQMTGWSIDILTEDEESERRQQEFQRRSNLFMDALDIDETMAQLLALEGFSSVEELAFADKEEVAQIKGFEASVAEDVHQRAHTEIQRRNEEFESKRRAAGVADELADVPSMTPRLLAALGEGGVLSIEDLAGCATDDLIGWYENEGGEKVHHKGIFSGMDFDREAAETMILNARRAAGWIEEEQEWDEEQWEEPLEEADVAKSEMEAALERLDGMSAPLLEALGRGGITTLDGLADCATDDLMGWEEGGNGGNISQEGLFTGMDISRQAAEALIMAARRQAGWFDDEVGDEGAGGGMAQSEPAEQSGAEAGARSGAAQ